MNWSPFLEVFVGLFLLVGIGLGWLTRIPVILIGAGAGVLVFLGILLAEQAADYEPWNWNIGADTLGIYFMLGVFAAIPAFLTALLGRFIKRRIET